MILIFSVLICRRVLKKGHISADSTTNPLKVYKFVCTLRPKPWKYFACFNLLFGCRYTT